MHLHLAILAVAAAASTASATPQACPLATPADFAAYPSRLRSIQPESLFGPGAQTKCPGGTDASPCGPHHVFVPAANNPNRTAARDRQFFIFLGGTASEPDKYDDLLAMAAYAGYRTIGLSYDNSAKMETVCGADCSCYEPARREVILGGNPSLAVNVLRDDTVVARLYQLIRYLDTTYPLEGWGDLLSCDDHDGVPEFTDIEWNRVVLSGHSQGAGHAMLISKRKLLDGVVIFDGGNDDCSTGGRTYAPWHDLPNLGAPQRAFVHDRGGTFALPDAYLAMDFGATPSDFSVIETTWPTTWEVASTNQTPPGVCDEHGSMAYDRCLPSSFSGGVVASSPSDAYLFPYYVRWMCEVGL